MKINLAASMTAMLNAFCLHGAPMLPVCVMRTQGEKKNLFGTLLNVYAGQFLSLFPASPPLLPAVFQSVLFPSQIRLFEKHYQGHSTEF